MGVKYCGLDVHQATTTAAVVGSRGRMVMETTVVTEEESLLAFVESLRGEVHLTFEESLYSEWLHELLAPRVERLVVCNPSQHIRSGDDKSDRHDARDLAERLRGGFLKAVYHREHGLGRLRQRVYAYRDLVRDSVRLQNRILALFRSRGLARAGDSVTQLRDREAELGACGRRQRCLWLYQQLDAVEALRAEAEAALKRERSRHEACRLVETVPCIGPIRGAILVSQIRFPYRFRTKRKLWKYSGLAVTLHSSSEYTFEAEGGLKRRRFQQTRGLNRQHNRLLKEVFKGAAMTASHHRVFGPWYEQRLAQGMRPANARLALARKLAAIVLAVWKKGEPFDEHRIESTLAA